MKEQNCYCYYDIQEDETVFLLKVYWLEGWGRNTTKLEIFDEFVTSTWGFWVVETESACEFLTRKKEDIKDWRVRSVKGNYIHEVIPIISLINQTDENYLIEIG